MLPIITAPSTHNFSAASKRKDRTAKRSKERIDPTLPILKGAKDAMIPHGQHLLRFCICASAQGDYIVRTASWGCLVHYLLRHVEREEKDGPAIIWGVLQNFRTDVDVVEVTALAYEVDGKLTLDEVCARVEASRYEAVIWTTHNHLRTSQDIGLATFKRWHLRTFGIEGLPTDTSVKRFCAEHKHYSHLTDVRLADGGKLRRVTRYGKRSEVFDIDHAPEHKTRIVFPLATPLKLKDGNLSISEFKSIYHAHGRAVLGDSYSTESQNPARLHYLPSHPSGPHGTIRHCSGILVDGENLSDQCRQAFKAVRPAPISATAQKKTMVTELMMDSPGLDQLSHVLRHIPPDLQYPDWFKCIAAIFYETSGSDGGAALAHSWSSGDPRYRFDEVERIWDGLDPLHPNPATIRTLLRFAREHDRNFRPYRPIALIFENSLSN